MKKAILLTTVMFLSCICGANLIGHWGLDEESGNIAYDTLGVHDGVLTNYTSNSWTYGQVDGALRFDGVNDYVTMGKVTAYDNLEQITMVAWVKLTQNVSDRHFVFGKEFLFKIDVERQKVRFLLGSNWDDWSGDRQTSTTHLSLNQWYHVAATYDGQYKRIYINGVNTDTKFAPLVSENIGSSNYEVTIGAHYSITDGYMKFFKGYIDDVAIFSKALSQEDIVAVMTYGAASMLPLSVSVDIKPASCPNPLNVKCSGNGVLPVAILGSQGFDVSTIVPTSIRLAGIAPVRDSFEDVGSPLTEPVDCECAANGPDGFTDLLLKFETQAIVEVLGELDKGDIVTLPLTGVLYDETPIEGADCVVIVGKHKPINPADINKDGFVNAVDMAIVAENWLDSSLIEE